MVAIDAEVVSVELVETVSRPKPHESGPVLEDGFDVPSDQSAEAPALSKLEYEALRARMDAEDPRIAAALELRVLGGWSVREIAGALSVSGPRVYQLIERAREIGEEYRREASP